MRSYGGPAFCGAAAASLVVVGNVTTYSAVVTAAGLGSLAWVDQVERRVPRRAFAAIAVGSAAAWLADARLEASWSLLARVALSGLAALVVLGTLWWRAPATMGLGDVKVMAFAAASSAAVSWSAVPRFLFATSLAGLALVVLLRVFRPRSEPGAVPRTVPFVPAICAGFILGVIE